MAMSLWGEVNNIKRNGKEMKHKRIVRTVNGWKQRQQQQQKCGNKIEITK